MLEPLFNKVAGLRPGTLRKETPTQMVSCEICTILKNICFAEHPRTAASASNFQNCEEDKQLFLLQLFFFS